MSGTSDNLISLGSLDDLTLIAVGHNGTIIKTSDGGENWSRVSSGVAEKLLAVGFADGQQGWIVGESGVILHTTNGGVSWGKQISGTSNLLRSISFITTQIGWAVGQNGTVIKTTNNGGVTLFPPTLLSPADQSTDISASTSLQWNSCAGATSYHIQLAQDISFSSSLLDQAGVETTSLTATGLTANSIYYWRVKTYYPEGASNWSEVFSFTTAGSGWIPAISGVTSNLRSVFFVSSNTGWAVGDAGTLLKTSGGGVSWNKKSINFSRTLTDIFFINESVGWTVGGWTSSIFKTTNGGDHWLAKSVGEELSFHSVQFINEFTGWAVADYDIFGTTDGGDNWQKLSSINSDLLVDAQFLSATTGWIIGWNDIYKTTDSGRTWINKTNGSLNLDLSEDLAHICLIDEKNGWVVSEAGRIFKTSDGESWSLVYSCEDCRLSTIMFIDQTTGWCAGESGMLLKTTDGGSSWGVQKSRTTRHLQSAYFIDSATGWLVGDNGIILRTKDGGGALQPPVEDQLINQNGGFEEATIGEKYGNDISGWTLWFDTQASATYKVVDNPVKEGNRALMLTAKALGANSWSIQAVNEPFTVKPDSVYTFSIWIKADKNGSVVIFTVGDPSYNEWKRTNKIVVTTQWQLVTFQFTAPHTASTGRAPIHFSDQSNSTYLPVTYYLDDLQIKKWRQSAEISEEKQQIASFALWQNYPTPFNSETTIQYQLPATTQVKLEIFDLLGKKVATLVDRWHASGSYAVRWNGKDEANKNVASGLYLYRLQAKGFVSTRKLVLVQ